MSSLQAGLSLLSAATPTAPPAGGFSEEDLGYAGAAAGFLLMVMLMGGLGHRAEMVPVIGWFDRFAERISGQPGWSSMPCGLAIMSLISALFGLYWDVSLHLDVGRDNGPFGTPAHYFILAGLYGIVLAGFFAMCLPAKKEGPTFLKITRDWHVPLGGVLMFASGSFSLLAFPLDDQWHRLFGQDVTLWGPTHLMLIGGASMALLGIAVLQVEVVRVMKRTGQIHTEKWWVKHLRNTWLPGGLLIALTTFQLEFDLGVPQFQLIFQPMLMMLAAGVVLVAARIFLGPGAALRAVAFFLVMRGLLYVSVDGLGESPAHFPLYIVEAALVEGIALLVSVKRNPLVFGAWCGVALGTVGLAAEWGWSHIWMPIPWPAEILPQVAALGLATALAASLIGAFMGARLGADEIPQVPGLRWAGLGGAAAVTAMIAFGLYTPAVATGVSGKVTLSDVSSGAGALGDRDRQARAGRRREGRHVADRDRMAGRRPHHRSPARRSGPASTARRSRSRCTARGSRRSACTSATSSTACRCTHRPTARSPRRSCPRRAPSSGRSSPTTRSCSARPGRTTRR